jgi:hypothetical protein
MRRVIETVELSVAMTVEEGVFGFSVKETSFASLTNEPTLRLD